MCLPMAKCIWYRWQKQGVVVMLGALGLAVVREGASGQDETVTKMVNNIATKLTNELQVR